MSKEVREKIVQWRQKQLSAGEIAELLMREGAELSIRTVERVLAEEGFAKLPRSTQLRIGRTVKGAEIPEKAEPVNVAALDGARYESDGAGVFLFAPFLAQLGIDRTTLRPRQKLSSRTIPAAGTSRPASRKR